MKILHLEDELKTAAAVKAFLEEQGIEVDHVDDVPEAKSLISSNKYDVIISDVKLPSGSGIDFCQWLRDQEIYTPVLILSALAELDDKITGLNSGSDDYMTKPFNLRELQARITALSRRYTSVPDRNRAFLHYDDIVMNLRTLEVTRNGENVPLTSREFKLLEYLILNKGRVIPKLEILENVWNLSEEINTNVIEVYINYLRKKIEKPGLNKIIHTHFGSGYILKDE